MDIWMEMDELEAQQDDNMETMEEIVAQKDNIDRQVNLLNSEIENINQQIRYYAQLIAENQTQLDEAQARLDALVEQNKERIRAMEEEGPISYWSVLFRAKSFTDLIDRLNMMAEIQAADERRLEEMALATEEVAQAREVLETYRGPDPIFDREKEILWVLIRLELAREALEQKRDLYARNLLQQTPVETAYLAEELTKKKLLLLGWISGESVAHQLPGIDSELLLRASEAYEAGDFQRSCHLLEAVENKSSSQWHLLRGKVCFRQQQWSEASFHLHQAEADFSGECNSLLEICYRELGNFQKAYEYACRQRN
jgi:hypothetical protein